MIKKTTIWFDHRHGSTCKLGSFYVPKVRKCVISFLNYKALTFISIFQLIGTKIDMDWWAYKKFKREHPLSNEKLMTSVCYINLECFSCYLGTLTRPKRSSFCWHLWLWTSILNLTLLAGCSSTCIEHSMVSYLKQCGILKINVTYFSVNFHFTEGA